VKPEELLYAKSHEWVHFTTSDGQRIATIGISAFAVEQLTDLVFLELPKVGRKIAASESIGEIESVKAVSDVYSPVAGEVIEVNTKLADHLELFNTDPYGAGWMVKIKVVDDAVPAGLMDFATYQKQIASEH
jgi:glycine cleavage system H protein